MILSPLFIIFVLIIEFFPSLLCGFIPTPYCEFKATPHDSHFFHVDYDHIVWSPESLRDNSPLPYKEYPLKQLIQRSLLYGFESQQGVVTLYKAENAVLEALGKTLPRLSLKIGLPSQGISGLLGGALGIVVPSNWTSLSAETHALKSQAYSYWIFLFNQIYATEIIYLNIQKAQIDFEIVRFYMQRLKGIIRHLSQEKIREQDEGVNDREIDILENLLGTMEMDAIDLKNAIAQSTTYLPFIANQPEFLDRADIRPLKRRPYPTTKHLKTDSLRSEILLKSLDLKMLKELIKEADQRWWSETLSFFSIDDAVNISLGIDNIARINMMKANIKSLKIKYDQTVLDLQVKVSSLVQSHNNAVDKFYTAKSLHLMNQDKFETLLSHYISRKTVEIEGLLHLIEYGIRYTLEMNASLHQYYLTLVDLNRLLLRHKNLAETSYLIQSLKMKSLYTNRNYTDRL